MGGTLGAAKKLHAYIRKFTQTRVCLEPGKNQVFGIYLAHGEKSEIVTNSVSRCASPTDILGQPVFDYQHFHLFWGDLLDPRFGATGAAAD